MKLPKIPKAEKDKLERLRILILGVLELLIFVIALISVFSIIYFYGFKERFLTLPSSFYTLHYLLSFFLLANSLRFIFNFKEMKEERMFKTDASFHIILTVYLLFLVFSRGSFVPSNLLVVIALLFLSFTNLARQLFSYIKRPIKPTLLLVLSFLTIIIIGSGLLFLPNSTIVPISFIDALFTATSAVCVTGLTTLDVASTFTTTGFVVILILIQIGGIGMLTFTSFFALAFMGKTSFSSRLVVKDLLNEDKWGNLFNVLRKVILVTFIIESLGIILIYLQIYGTFPPEQNELFFAVFHSISAYCNAGISTLQTNLCDPLVFENYGLYYCMAFLIVVGGIGFPIVNNYLQLIKHFLGNLWNILIGRQQKYHHLSHIINLHTKVVLLTTFILIIGGWGAFFLFEHHQAMANLDLQGKIATSLFGAISPRTAGFTSLPMSSLSNSTLFLTVVLMLVGASPMSTGGGLKTTTLFVALLSTFSFARGKNSVEYKRKEIPMHTIHRAFAILVLYFVWAICASFSLSITEGSTPVFTLFFEVISALSTVGLSIDFTPNLSFEGKIIIILTMFIGRIGVLSFCMSLLKVAKPKYYTYPPENLLMG